MYTLDGLVDKTQVVRSAAKRLSGKQRDYKMVGTTY